MINSIFYFADTEQEYLDNFNSNQVKPYTIVFCRDTRSLWKNGVKYGGDSTQTGEQIQSWVETHVTPLITQLQNALAEANQTAADAYARLDAAIAAGAGNVEDLQEEVSSEKSRLTGLINGINSRIQDEVESMLTSSQWIEENWPQGVTDWQAGWDEELERYLSTVGYWDVDPVTGESVTKWSTLQQGLSSVQSSVNQITRQGGTIDTLRSTLEQSITNEGTIRNDMSTEWAQKQEGIEAILKWMYSGLTMESGENQTFANLVAAAEDGAVDGISTIGALVEKIPVIDQQTGEPAVDQDGNIIYQKDSNNNYVYRAKSTFSSALNDSLATMINEATDHSASSEIVSSVGSYLAGIKATADDAAENAQLALSASSGGTDLSTFLLKTDLETAIGEICVKKGMAAGTVFTGAQKLANGNYVSTAGLTSAVNDAISNFTVQATTHSAGGTLVSKLRNDSEDLAMLKTEINDAKGAYASLGAKFAGVESGLVAKSDLNEAVAALVTDGTRTVKLTVLDSLPSGATYFNTTQQLPSELDQHTKLRYSVSEFTALIATIFVHKQVAPDTYDDVPASYGVNIYGTYDVHPGSYLKCSDDKYLYIEEISLKSSVFSEVDTRISTATSGLVASNDFTAASIVAMVNGAGSSVNINADKINLTGQTTFITAVGQALNVQQLVADEVAATTISANTIDASSSYTVTDENDQSTTYTSHTIVDGDGVRVYNGATGHQYNASNEDVNDANSLLDKSGEGWVANGHIKWNAEGDTYIGPGDPEDGDDGIYVYDDDGVTKIKLQGEITAKDLSWDNIRGTERLGDGYRVGNKKKYESGERDVVGALYDYGFYVALQTFYHQPANSNGAYGDYIMGHGPSQDETSGSYTTVDWGAIGMGRNNIAAVPNPRNTDARPINYNQYTDGSRNTPPVTLQVKGKDGYVYTGFTGTHNDMYYINGIAIGPAGEAGSNSTMI